MKVMNEKQKAEALDRLLECCDNSSALLDNLIGSGRHFTVAFPEKGKTIVDCWSREFQLGTAIQKYQNALEDAFQHVVEIDRMGIDRPWIKFKTPDNTLGHSVGLTVRMRLEIR